MELSGYQFLKTENKKGGPQHLRVSHFRLKVGFALSIYLSRTWRNVLVVESVLMNVVLRMRLK